MLTYSCTTSPVRIWKTRIDKMCGNGSKSFSGGFIKRDVYKNIRFTKIEECFTRKFDDAEDGSRLPTRSNRKTISTGNLRPRRRKYK